MARFEPGKGPVVLCFSGGSVPAGATASVALDPLPVEAAYFAAGTGIDRLDVATATRTLADKHMPLNGTTLENFIEYLRGNRGTFTDFYTQKEKPKCRLHLFVDIVRDGDSLAAFHALLEVLLPYDLPLGIHAFLGGPEKTAYLSFEGILDRVGDRVPVLTMSGADFAIGANTEWDKILEAYRALVMLFEGEMYQSVDHPIEDNYNVGREDVGMPPVRLGDFDGITGDLRLDFPAPPGAPPEPQWEWRSDDLGMIISSRGDHMERLLRVLTRSGLPDHVADMVTVRGRPVCAFSASTLMSLVPMRGVDLKTLLDTRSPHSLVEVCQAAGKRCARVLDAEHAALGTFSFDGDRDIAASATVEADAVAAATTAVEAADLVIVAATDGDLEPLLAAVSERGGALLLVSSGQLSIFGEGLTATSEVGAYRDLFATVLELVGVEAPASGARSLVKQ